jgi:hypothetical protein
MLNEEELRGELGFRVDCRDKSQPIKAMMATFLADDVKDDDVDLITDVMTHAAATPRGTYETSTQVLAELSRDVQDPRQGPVIPAKVPSWNTYRRALLDFGQDPVEGNEEPEAEPEPEPELVKVAGKARLSETDFDYTSEGTFRKHVQLGYDVRKVNQHIDGVCRATFLAATDLARRRDDLPLFIINKDGNPHPLYAESWKYGKSAERHGPQDGKDFTPIGRLGSGAFRDKGPMYPGTVNKLEYYVMSAHFLETNETFCLGFRWGAPNPRSQISMRDELEKYPDAPILMMSDKGFASEEFTRNDRAYCDPRGTIMITPLPRWAWVREIVADLWNSGEAKAVPGAGKTLLYGQRRSYWADLTVLPFNVAVFFTEEDPEDYLEDPEAFGVFELAPKLFAVAFYTNLEVDHPEVAKWFEAQYSGRWACENLYKRAKALLGRSQGQTPFPRHLWYAFGMFVIAGLGLWRLRQRIRIDFWDAWTRGISRNLFLDPMKRFIERRFESPKTRKK